MNISLRSHIFLAKLSFKWLILRRYRQTFKDELTRNLLTWINNTNIKLKLRNVYINFIKLNIPSSWIRSVMAWINFAIHSSTLFTLSLDRREFILTSLSFSGICRALCIVSATVSSSYGFTRSACKYQTIVTHKGIIWGLYMGVWPEPNYPVFEFKLHLVPLIPHSTIAKTVLLRSLIYHILF